jgi:glycerophosphoryl diester phosphodiesterase
VERSAWPYPFWIAHRGAGRLAPENTLAAFRTGAGHGYRMFECDVKLSADGVPFLLHDATLDRTTNAPATPAAGGGSVAGEQPWSALSQLDAGSWHSRAYAGETLPTLAAVSRWCRANGHNLNIEIKPTPGTAHPTGVAVAQAASTLWAGASTPPLLTSFQTDALAGALEAAPELPRGLLLDHLRTDWLDVAASLRCQAVVCHHALWEASTVALARDHGLRCLSYTVNDDGEAQRLIALGTDGIITDRVDLFSPAG